MLHDFLGLLNINQSCIVRLDISDRLERLRPLGKRLGLVAKLISLFPKTLNNASEITTLAALRPAIGIDHIAQFGAVILEIWNKIKFRRFKNSTEPRKFGLEVTEATAHWIEIWSLHGREERSLFLQLV
jgi:hypothetical protein